MKKLIVLLCAAFTFMTAYAAAPEGPVYADALNNGSYKIEVDSSSSMFRIVDCELTVSGGEMHAVMTLSGTGYEKLFMGSGEEAQSAPDEDCIYFIENAEGKYTYTVPVAALNAEIDCAAWSFRKQQWYDRTLVFEAGSLPDDAFKGGISPVMIAVIVVAAVLAAAVVIICAKKAKRN